MRMHLLFIEHRDGVLTRLRGGIAAPKSGSPWHTPLTAVILGSDPAHWPRNCRLRSGRYKKRVTRSSVTTPRRYAMRGACVKQLDPHLVSCQHSSWYATSLQMAARFGKSLISDCIRASSGEAITFRGAFLGSSTLMLFRCAARSLQRSVRSLPPDQRRRERAEIAERALKLARFA